VSRARCLIVTDTQQFEYGSSKPKQPRASATLVEGEWWNANQFWFACLKLGRAPL
jgi:hypothetical protein